MNKINCPNCGAPIDGFLNKCPYCDAPYIDGQEEIILYADNVPIICMRIN